MHFQNMGVNYHIDFKEVLVNVLVKDVQFYKFTDAFETSHDPGENFDYAYKTLIPIIAPSG
jgi:hypothetical protein